MLRGEPWAPSALAGRLGLTTSEAEGILALYGYESELPDRWIFVAGDVKLGLEVSDISARVVKAYTNEARSRFAGPDDALDEELRELFMWILEQAHNHGEIKGLQSDDYLRRYGRPD
jgi:hypothetical protein